MSSVLSQDNGCCYLSEDTKMSNFKRTLSLGLVSAAVMTSGSALAKTNPFGQQMLESGYMQTITEGKCGEGQCGGKQKMHEEGKCGDKKAMKKMAGEGKCGESKDVAQMDMKHKEMMSHDMQDKNMQDKGMTHTMAMSESMEKKTAEGKCGEDKKMKEGNCSAMKKAAKEGKCGEGKCGASKR